ncbi:unnamed protein product [Effrenium voratum]|uniref:Uncharacterized protein n=1 Tax=Effrenium voratum TaxID=2562239 RepID=A0AA36I2S9_9DINO|nr:unnamed protein product [Effrenium voratum]CAJ1379687.1 unnamed protein product [Effrenium voratum]CAJ1419853.1 unnamed protein product [Effrenium voratum]
MHVSLRRIWESNARFLLGSVLLLGMITVILRIVRRCAAPRGAALRNTSWRDLCLLRAERVSRLPFLASAFETSRSQWLAEHRADPRSSCQPGGGDVPKLPAVLQLQPMRTLEDWQEHEALGFAWETLDFLNASFFDGQLAVDEIRLVQSQRELAKIARRVPDDEAEASVRVDFSTDFTRAWLWIEFNWTHCHFWTASRLASVLLHELVHVWHESNWARTDQLVTAHSSDFIRKCAHLNELCCIRELPFFPNVFTESWTTLVDSSLIKLPFGSPLFTRRWVAYLETEGHFSGSLLEDLGRLGVSQRDVMVSLA